ncbi:MAG: signal peptidase I [Lachnospiraceae bacterium]|nr:signal peptidase I [Lachnospiraceae bacterium]
MAAPEATPEEAPTDAPEEEDKKKNRIKETLSWVRVIVIAILIGLFLTRVVIVNATVPSGSMEPTVMTGDRVIGLRLAYMFSSPKRGDVIVFKYPDDRSVQYLKRIIGLPGEKVEIKDGKVYINDSEEPLEEEYLTVVPTGNYGPYFVPEDSYFMLGDNRNNSKDSRYWKNTYVKKEDIVAKVLFGYYPKFYWVK